MPLEECILIWPTLALQILPATANKIMRPHILTEENWICCLLQSSWDATLWDIILDPFSGLLRRTGNSVLIPRPYLLSTGLLAILCGIQNAVFCTRTAKGVCAWRDWRVVMEVPQVNVQAPGNPCNQWVATGWRWACHRVWVGVCGVCLCARVHSVYTSTRVGELSNLERKEATTAFERGLIESSEESKRSLCVHMWDSSCWCRTRSCSYSCEMLAPGSCQTQSVYQVYLRLVSTGKHLWFLIEQWG